MNKVIKTPQRKKAEAQYLSQLLHTFHRGQVDKGGENYLLHLGVVAQTALLLAEKALSPDDYKEIKHNLEITAALHDILEDTDCPYEILDKPQKPIQITIGEGEHAITIQQVGFDAEVVQAVKYLTKPKDTSEFDFELYFWRIKNDTLARFVKMADLMHNSILMRLLPNKDITMKDIKRSQKYLEQLEYLMEEENGKHKKSQ